jgi:hypothetical protein
MKYYALPLNGEYDTRLSYDQSGLQSVEWRDYAGQFTLELTLTEFLNQYQSIAGWMDRNGFTDADFDAILEVSENNRSETCVLVAFLDSDQRMLFKMKYGGNFWMT